MVEQQNGYLEVDGVKIVGDNNKLAREEAERVFPAAKSSSIMPDCSGYECYDGTIVNLVQYRDHDRVLMSFASVAKGDQRMCFIVPENRAPIIRFYKGEDVAYESDISKLPEESKEKAKSILEQYVPGKKDKNSKPLNLERDLEDFISMGIKKVNGAISAHDARLREQKKQDAFDVAFAQFTGDSSRK